MDNKKEEFDISRVALSFSKGDVSGQSRKLLIYLTTVTILFFVALIALLAVVLFINYKNGEMNLTIAIIGIVGATIAVGLIVAYLIYYFRKNEKARKEILLRLKDAVPLRGYCKTIGTRKENVFTARKLQVDFDYNGEHFTRTTSSVVDESKFKPSEAPGYYKMMSKYADREVDLLYSPAYDDVMISKGDKYNPRKEAALYISLITGFYLAFIGIILTLLFVFVI